MYWGETDGLFGTDMNLSGESVRALMDYYKLTTDEIVIIYDDISMPVGQVRIRPKGSAGGHNGIKSIIAHLGTQEFPRIKIGVGAKPENGDLVKHVLGRFSKEDDAKIRDVFALAEEGLLAILQEDVKTAMNADRKSTRLNSSHTLASRMPSSA